MKILHIITGLHIGGAERALYNLMAGGLADRFDCEVLSLSDAGKMSPMIQKLGVPVHVVGMRSGTPMPKALLGFRQKIREIEPDVIQGWMYHGNLAASFARVIIRHHPPVAWNIRHSLYDIDKEKILTRQVIKAGRGFSSHPDAVIYNSRLSRAQHEEWGYKVSKGIVIPNGFCLQQKNSKALKSKAQIEELGFNNGEVVIGHVARFHPLKDHTNFLRAAAIVARQFPSSRFVLVGREVVPENSLLTDLIPNQLLPQFRFLGERSDVPLLMKSFDVLCSSSWSEAFPNVLGEAMASAVPCVTTDVGDSAFIVGETGFVVPPSDSNALANAMMRMLNMSAEDRRALGLTAFERVSTKFSLDKVVAQYTQLYESLASNTPKNSNDLAQ